MIDCIYLRKSKKWIVEEFDGENTGPWHYTGSCNGEETFGFTCEKENLASSFEELKKKEIADRLWWIEKYTKELKQINSLTVKNIKKVIND